MDWEDTNWSKWVTTSSKNANQFFIDNSINKDHTLDFEFTNIGSKNDGSISILKKCTNPSEISSLIDIDPGDDFCMRGRYHFIAFIIENNGGTLKWRRRLSEQTTLAPPPMRPPMIVARPDLLGTLEENVSDDEIS